MTKLIALCAITILMALSGLGNFWFTYGIWPKSWAAFGIFWLLGFILSLTLALIADEKS